MNAGTMHDATAVNLECECVPPLDLPETWGVSWDRQLAAVEAFHTAWTEVEERSVRMNADGNVHRFVERRTRMVVIDFPDRRRAA